MSSSTLTLASAYTAFLSAMALTMFPCAWMFCLINCTVLSCFFISFSNIFPWSTFPFRAKLSVISSFCTPALSSPSSCALWLFISSTLAMILLMSSKLSCIFWSNSMSDGTLAFSSSIGLASSFKLVTWSCMALCKVRLDSEAMEWAW